MNVSFIASRLRVCKALLTPSVFKPLNKTQTSIAHWAIDVMNGKPQDYEVELLQSDVMRSGGLHPTKAQSQPSQPRAEPYRGNPCE